MFFSYPLTLSLLPHSPRPPQTWLATTTWPPPATTTFSFLHFPSVPRIISLSLSLLKNLIFQVCDLLSLLEIPAIYATKGLFRQPILLVGEFRALQAIRRILAILRSLLTHNLLTNSSLGMRVPRSLEVWKLGTVNYLDALKLQERLVSDRKAHRIPDTLLSLQHPPTYTLGKRRTDHNLLIPESELKKIGAELHYTQRGGDITFHGPHQAILYPIISLRDIGLGARNYVENLELTMIELASLYGVKACAGQTGETGVWVGDRKIGAIGVRISYGITSHGLAFNIDPDLNYFKHIVPCGIADKEVTSLRTETGIMLPAEEVIHEQLISCFARLFSYSSIIWKENPSILLDNKKEEWRVCFRPGK